MNNILYCLSGIIICTLRFSCGGNPDGNRIVKTDTCIKQLELILSEEVTIEMIPAGDFSASFFDPNLERDSLRGCLRDAWGSWFMMRYNKETNKMTIWSRGPNMRDDKGGTDDYLREVDLHRKTFRFLPSQKAG